MRPSGPEPSVSLLPPRPSTKPPGLPAARARPNPSWRQPKSGPASWAGRVRVRRPLPFAAAKAAARRGSNGGVLACKLVGSPDAPGGAVGRLCLSFPLSCPSGYATGDNAREGFGMNAMLIIPVILWLRGGPWGLNAPRIRRQLWVLNLERVASLRRIVRAALSPDPRPPKSLPASPQAAFFWGGGGTREEKFTRGDFCLFRGLAGFGGVWPPASTGKKCD